MEKYESERIENRQRIARAVGFNSLEDMKNKVGESIIKSIGYFPEWTILEEADPLNNIGLN